MLPALALLLPISIALCASFANAAPYFEVGTSMATMSNGGKYFNQSDAQSSNTGFLGSFSFYTPLTSERHFFHVDLGLQNRLLKTSTSDTGSSLAMASNDLSVRLQIARFYIGAGYAPLTYVSKLGGSVSSLHTNPGTESYFFETGAIWRIIPEFSNRRKS